jgi:oligosaccharide translocation protein RFT1
MAGFSVVFVLATGLFYGFGFRDVSLIYANIANLVSRMLFAAHFISSYFREQHTGNLILWSPMVPTGAFIIGAMGSGAVVRAYASHYAVVDIIRVNGRSAVLKSVVLQHISLGSALAVACASIWWVQTGQRLSLSSQKKD